MRINTSKFVVCSVISIIQYLKYIDYAITARPERFFFPHSFDENKIHVVFRYFLVLEVKV